MSRGNQNGELQLDGAVAVHHHILDDQDHRLADGVAEQVQNDQKQATRSLDHIWIFVTLLPAQDVSNAFEIDGGGLDLLWLLEKVELSAQPLN